MIESFGETFRLKAVKSKFTKTRFYFDTFVQTSSKTKLFIAPGIFDSGFETSGPISYETCPTPEIDGKVPDG